MHECDLVRGKLIKASRSYSSVINAADAGAEKDMVEGGFRTPFDEHVIGY